MWGMVAAPTRAQRNQQLPSLDVCSDITNQKKKQLANLPWLTSSLLEPSTTRRALGKRLLARTHLISEASVLTFNWNVAFFGIQLELLPTFFLPLPKRAESPSTLPE